MITDYWMEMCEKLVMSWDADGCDWKPQHQDRWNATVEHARAALEREDKSKAQSKELNRLEMKAFACKWWNKFGFVKDKATCSWVIDEIDPDHFVDFMFDVLTEYGHDTHSLKNHD